MELERRKGLKIENAKAQKKFNMRQNALVAASLFVPVCLFNPVAIFYLNAHAGEVSLGEVVIVFGTITFVLYVAYVCILYFLSDTKARRVRTVTLALALTFYIQTHVFSTQSQIDLRGDAIDWGSFDFWPSIEIALLGLIFAAGLLAVTRYAHRVTWMVGFFLCASLVSIVPDVYVGITSYKSPDSSTAIDFDNTVYSFSSAKNIVHLMPDGVQADIAMEVLRKNADLADKFDGFTLYASHLGTFPSTAPSLPTVFNGEIYDLSRGYVAASVRQEIEEKSFIKHLSEAGVRLDFAPIVPLVCVGKYSSCVPMGFNDLRSRGYETFQRSAAVNLALIADVALFRQSPIILKQYIYADGNWWISKWVAKGTADYRTHAPVLEEWRTNSYVADAQPRYKWYHWIGAHPPAQWDGDCDYLGPQERSREVFVAQTKCVLSRIAGFIERLQELDIYDATMIVVNADHGSGEPPNDLKNYVDNNFLRRNQLGMVRPLLMVKPFTTKGALRIDDAPTSLVDIAPTILDAMDIPHSYDGWNILNVPSHKLRIREYHHYNPSAFSWSSTAVPVDRFVVQGDPRDWHSWTLVELWTSAEAPTSIPRMTAPELQPFIRGVSFAPATKDTWAWVQGNQLALSMRADEAGRHEFMVELHVPNKNNGQVIELSLNGSAISVPRRIEPVDTWWQQVRFCIPEDAINVKGQNLFSMRFSIARRLSDSDRRYLSVIASRATLSPTPNCQ